MSFAWYLAQLKPNARHIAERNLARQRFETFLPLIQQTGRKGGRFVQTKKPLFPGYIFIRFDTKAGGWRAINSTQGVVKLVSFGRTPAPVPDALVTELKDRSDANGLVSPTPQVTVGDTVTVAHGPFAEFLAQIVEMDDDQRVWLLIDLMGRQTRVSARTKDLRPG